MSGMAIELFETIDVKVEDMDNFCCRLCGQKAVNIDVVCYCVECHGYFCASCLPGHDRDDLQRNLSKENCTTNERRKAISIADLRINVSQEDGERSRINKSAGPQKRVTFSKTEKDIGKTFQTLISQDGYSEKNGYKLVERNKNKHVSMTEIHAIERQDEATEAPADDTVLKKTYHSAGYQASIIKELKNKKKQLEEAKQTKAQAMKKLEEEKKEILERVDQFEAAIVEVVRDMRSNLVGKLDDVFRRQESRCDAMIHNLQKGLEATFNCLQQVGTHPESSTDDAECYINDMVKSHHESINEGCLTESLISTIRCQMRDFLKEGIEDVTYGINKLEAHFDQTAVPLITSYDVSMDGEQSVCDINSVCQLKDGTMVIADYNNCKLKHLNQSFQVTDTCDLAGIPWAVCSTGPNEIAASLYLMRKIQFVCISPKMTPVTSFKVRETCRGVAYHDKQLFVSCGGRGLGEGPGQVRVYTPTGELLKTIQSSPGMPMFSCPQHIAVDETGSTIFVVDPDKGVIMLDRNGNIQQTYHSLDIKEPKGVCLGDKGSLYVCGHASDLVHQVDQTGKKIREICLNNNKHYPRYLQSLFVNLENSQMILTMGNSNHIQVLKL